jgi:NAD(P)-dependent dehydrogenase (short-subunit alcohol dehydrogenase family)
MKKIVLITGGSRGIGAATALLAAKNGYSVAINFNTHAQAAHQLTREITAFGGHAIAVQADVADERQVMAMFQTLDRELGPLTALVNNAGVVDVACKVEGMSAQRIERMFAINVFGTMYCARQAVLRMSHHHGGAGGSIVNVSSLAASLGSPNQYVDYAAAKGAVDVFTLGLGREVATEGIRVNAVRPGVIDTDIHASGGQPERAQTLAKTIPMQRPGSAQEVAQAIVWLLSDEASYTTASLLDVGGGR